MKLQSIKIKNFKSLQTVDFEPTDFACLVGENNAGKSSVLQAVNIALKRPPQLPSEQFYDTSNPVEFKLTFTDVSAADLNRIVREHRERMDPLVTNGSLTIYVRYEVGQKLSITIQKKIPSDIRYQSDAIAAVFAGKRGAAVKAALAANFPEFIDGAPEEPNITQAKSYVEGRIAQLPPEAFVEGETPLPSGIASSITDLLPEPIYIPAVKDLGDEMKTSQSTSFGRLLGLLLNDMMPDLTLVRQALERLNQLFNRTGENAELDERHEKVRELETLIPTLDALRAAGICVLAKGAIEDYYPQGVPSGAKPDRALAATTMINTMEQARALSMPLAVGREPELCEIFAEVFR